MLLVQAKMQGSIIRGREILCAHSAILQILDLLLMGNTQQLVGLCKFLFPAS